MLKTMSKRPHFLKNIKIPIKEGVSKSFKKEMNVPLVDCKNCKYYIQQEKYKGCKLFKYLNIITDYPFDFFNYIDVELCRSDKSLCGPNGVYFKKNK